MLRKNPSLSNNISLSCRPHTSGYETFSFPRYYNQETLSSASLYYLKS